MEEERKMKNPTCSSFHELLSPWSFGVFHAYISPVSCGCRVRGARMAAVLPGSGRGGRGAHPGAPSAGSLFPNLPALLISQSLQVAAFAFCPEASGAVGGRERLLRADSPGRCPTPKAAFFLGDARWKPPAAPRPGPQEPEPRFCGARPPPGVFPSLPRKVSLRAAGFSLNASPLAQSVQDPRPLGGSCP